MLRTSSLEALKSKALALGFECGNPHAEYRPYDGCMQICGEPFHVSGIKEQALEIFLGPGAVDHVINVALQRFAPSASSALFLFWRFLHAVTIRASCGDYASG